MQWDLLALLLLPFLSAISLFLALPYLKKNQAGIIASLTLLISFGLSWLLQPHAGFTFSLFSYLVGSVRTSLSLHYDGIAALFVYVILGVGFLVHVYAIGYMAHEEDRNRFFSAFNLFVGFMLLLVLSGNLITLMIGWAGVGLTSYLLIGYYQTDVAKKAARLAFVTNTIGDLALLLGSALILMHWHTLSISSMLQHVQHRPLGGWWPFALFLFMVAAFAKSSQLPLQAWLVEAMAGPTPVSALMHAATMVTAGVYLMARLAPLYATEPYLQVSIAWVGGLSALYAALSAIGQWNLKRVLAYSTISQLGYMFMAIGVGTVGAGLFHFLTHAFFKALLFLVAGVIIHSLSGEEDMRNMGGLSKKLPRMAILFAVGGLALAGFPGFSGFFSKGAVLGAVFASGQTALWLIGSFTAALTAFYIYRAFYWTFLASTKITQEIHAVPLVMEIPLWVLGFFALVGGVFSGPVHALLSVVVSGHWGFAWDNTEAVTTAFVVVGFSVSYFLYRNRESDPLAQTWLYAFLTGGMGFRRGISLLFQALYEVSGVVMKAALTIVPVLDGTVPVVSRVRQKAAHMQSGYYRQYTLTFLGGALILVLLAIFLPQGGWI